MKDIYLSPLNKIYASMWNFRAYEERDFYRVDHFIAAMGMSYAIQTLKQSNLTVLGLALTLFTIQIGTLLFKYSSWRIIDYQPRPKFGSRGDFIVSRSFTRGWLSRIKTVQSSRSRRVGNGSSIS